MSQITMQYYNNRTGLWTKVDHFFEFWWHFPSFGWFCCCSVQITREVTVSKTTTVDLIIRLNFFCFCWFLNNECFHSYNVNSTPTLPEDLQRFTSPCVGASEHLSGLSFSIYLGDWFPLQGWFKGAQRQTQDQSSLWHNVCENILIYIMTSQKQTEVGC